MYSISLVFILYNALTKACVLLNLQHENTTKNSIIEIAEMAVHGAQYWPLTSTMDAFDCLFMARQIADVRWRWWVMILTWTVIKTGNKRRCIIECESWFVSTSLVDFVLVAIICGPNQIDFFTHANQTRMQSSCQLNASLVDRKYSNLWI